MKLFSMIKTAVVSLLNNDNSKYPTTQVSANDVAWEVMRASPYGIASHPPLDSLAIVLSANGHCGDPIAFICSPTERSKNLKSGEVVVENPIAKSQIKFNDAGDIEVETGPSGELIITVPAGDATMDVTGNVTIRSTANITVEASNLAITAPTMTLNGNLAVTGSITATVDVQAGPANTSLISHVHAITSGSSAGSTAPPT